MSAWTLSGALVLTPIAVLGWLAWFYGDEEKAKEMFVPNAILSIVAVFCIVRCLGIPE